MMPIAFYPFLKLGLYERHPCSSIVSKQNLIYIPVLLSIYVVSINSIDEEFLFNVLASLLPKSWSVDN